MRAAEIMADQIKKDIERDCLDYAEYFPDSTNNESGRPKDFLRLWDNWYATLERSEATKRKYRSAMDVYWLPIWKDRDFRYIPSLELQQAIAAVNWGSAKHRNGCITPLRGMYKTALKAGWIKDDPMLDVQHLKPKTGAPDPLEPIEMIKVLKWIKDNHGEIWEIHYGFRFYSGVRPGECYALLPSDADWTTDTFRVDKNQSEEGLRYLTKTGESRDIEFNEYSRGYFRRAMDLMKDNQETVFAHESGKRIATGNMPRKVWNAALKAQKIPHRSSYNTRHTCITMYIMSGTVIFWLANQMGNSAQVIERNYARWIRKVARDRESSKLKTYLDEIIP